MELMKAHQQWKTRPLDQRFRTLSDLHKACEDHRDFSAEKILPYNDLKIENDHREIYLTGPSGKQAKLNNWSFNQLCGRAAAPTGYLRTLPTELAAQNLRHGLESSKRFDTGQAQLFFDTSNELTVKALTSERYSRIWNADITKRLMQIQEENPNWKNPMAYKISEPGSNGAWPTLTGEMEPAGLYASDHDMFAFLVDESKTLDAGSPKGLNRGFFCWNSEVGASSFGFMAFLYDRVCGNNIVWGAKDVTQIKIRHVGEANDKAFGQLKVEMKKYLDSSSSELENRIKEARTYYLGHDKKSVIDAILDLPKKVLSPELSQTKLAQAIEIGEQNTDRYGEPYTLWSVISGLTVASQFSGYADERMKIDKAAGKLLNVIDF